jgi:hypothetical protein
MHFHRHQAECCQTNREKENGNPKPQTATLPGWSSTAEALRQRFSGTAGNSTVKAIELQTGQGSED